jgi:hypothetical protein
LHVTSVNLALSGRRFKTLEASKEAIGGADLMHSSWAIRPALWGDWQGEQDR